MEVQRYEPKAPQRDSCLAGSGLLPPFSLLILNSHLDGASLLPKLETLANFADFMAAGGWPPSDGGPVAAPVDIFSAT